MATSFSHDAVMGSRLTVSELIAQQRAALRDASDTTMREADRLGREEQVLLERLRAEVRRSGGPALQQQLARSIAQKNRDRAALVGAASKLSSLASFMAHLDGQNRIQETMVEAAGLLDRINTAIPFADLGTLMGNFAKNMEMLQMKQESLVGTTDDAMTEAAGDADGNEALETEAADILSQLQDEVTHEAFDDRLPLLSTVSGADAIRQRADAKRADKQNRM